MTALFDIGTLITRNPEVGGGRPILSGTAVRVRSIATRHKGGLTPEKIADSYGHLSLAQIYAALTYYHANREEIETDLAEEERLYDQLVRERGSNSRGRSEESRTAQP